MKALSLILVSAWALGSIFLLAAALSRAAFSRNRTGRRLTGLVQDAALVVVWPFALASTEGRQYINQVRKTWR